MGTIEIDREWTRLTFAEDSGSGDMAVLSVRDAGVTGGPFDRRRKWEYRVELVLSESKATRKVPAGRYTVSEGDELGSPVDVRDAMRALESLASLLDNDREHLEHRETDVCPEHGDRCDYLVDSGCPEHGARCVALIASPELRHFLVTWGEDLGCWANERELRRSDA